jgi:hypothetical protein
MSNLFPNSAILSLSSMTEKPTQAAVVPSMASTAVNKKRTKAHRRHQRRNRGSRPIDTIIMMVNDGSNRVKLPKEQRRANKKIQKALSKKMKKQQIAIADKKRRKTKDKKPHQTSNVKQEKVSQSKNNGILPEERAYKRSLRLNRKDHALKEGDKVARKEVKISLVETLSNIQKEAVQKRKLAILQSTLPEERAYRQSIGQDPGDFLDPCLI